MADNRGEPERLRIFVDGETVDRANYIVEVLRLAKEFGEAGRLLEVDVEHQVHCSFFNGANCDCRPRVSVAGRPECSVRRAFRK